MNPQEQRIADALIDRVRQKRDTIDPELAQRIHQGLRDAPDAFYLLAQAAVAQGIQLEGLQMQQAPMQDGWQQQQPPQQQRPGLLESIFGPGTPSGAQPPYAQQPYGAPPQSGYPQQTAMQPSPGQPVGSAGYQAVNASLPGANLNPVPQYPASYGQPYGAPAQAYPQGGYGAQYPSQPYPQQGYSGPQGYPASGYGQPAYPGPGMVQSGYSQVGASGLPPGPGYPQSSGWGQPGGGMLNGVGGVVAGAAAGALVTGAVESVIHGYEEHERREDVAREEHHDRDSSWHSDHERGIADTDADRNDSGFYDPAKDASRDDSAGASSTADTDRDDADDSVNDSSDDDASDFGGFSDNDN